MRPMRTPASNFTYLGPRPDIGDLPCERVVYEDGDSAVYAVYELIDEDRQAIAEGANVKLGIWNQEPIPPVSLRVTGEQAVEGEDVERPVPDQAPELLRRNGTPPAAR